jgi:hypothetical protein
MTTSEVNSTKADAVRKLLSSGQATLSETARLAGESKQRIAYWARGIDPVAARAAYLAKLWRAHGDRPDAHLAALRKAR